MWIDFERIQQAGVQMKGRACFVVHPTAYRIAISNRGWGAKKAARHVRRCLRRLHPQAPEGATA